MPIKKSVDQWLREVKYDYTGYMPSDFAFKFINFIKLVNGGEGEENATPPLHYKMLDTMIEDGDSANMLFRGAAKTTVFAEYMTLYIATYGELDEFGKINVMLYVSDSMENGAKNFRKNVEYRWENSDFLREYVPQVKFTDTRLEFINKAGKKLVCKLYGAKALSLDSKLYTDNGFTTIGECKVGDKIFTPDGTECSIVEKSEIFNKPMYEIKLLDGRRIKVSEDHINSVQINVNPNNKTDWRDFDLTTLELLQLPLRKKYKGSSKGLIAIKNTDAVEFTEKEYRIDPYLFGLLLGDGSMKKDGSVVLHAHIDDIEFYKRYINEELGSEYIDKRNANVVSLAIKKISSEIRRLGVNVHGNYKFVPMEYMRGSVEQRLELLKGLMDTDGTISITSRMSFCSNSEQLATDVAELVRSLGGEARIRKSLKAFKVEIKTDFNIFKLERKSSRFKKRIRTTNRVPIVSITRIEGEPSQCIAVDSSNRQFLTDNYTRTHNTGVRGAKEMGKRPEFAILDDLISDEDARSPTVVASVEDTVYKAIDNALHPSKRKVIWNGTPFNQNDPLYKAIGSGAWNVNVFPVCEEFDESTTEETFRGAWSDRFTFQAVKRAYEKAKNAGKISAFYQEMMLQIMNEEDRLIADDDIVWFDRSDVLKNKGRYNFYITTDFSFSEKQSADFSVISVWAHNANGDWMLVDGACKKRTIDKSLDDLFKFIQRYKPMSVGIEISGQQVGLIKWLDQQMIQRNVYFNIAQEKETGQRGFRPTGNKFVRFQTVVPLFKTKKIWIASDLKDSELGAEFINEVRNCSVEGFKSKHDDVLDTVTQLGMLNAFRPSDEVEYEWKDKDGSGIWSEIDFEEKTNNSLIF